MEKNNNHDKYFRELLSDGNMEMPFNDFEDELMAEIRSEQEKRSSLLRNIRLSWLFFILGLVSGIALVLVSSSPGISTVENLPGTFVYTAIIFICLFILLFAEKLISISRQQGH